jgi:repressor LexA
MQIVNYEVKMAKPTPLEPNKLNGPFNDLIQSRMKELGLSSVGAFAEYAQVARATMYNVVAGRISENGTYVKPSTDTIFALARALRRPAHELLYRLDPEAYGATEAPRPPNLVTVPVIGFVGAGPGQSEMLEQSHVCVSSEFAARKDLVAFQVRGDSMEGGKRPIRHGDRVVVNRADKGASGDAVVARLSNGTMVCKLHKDDLFGWQLLSANPMHTNGTPSRIMQDEVAEVIGRVVQVIGDAVNQDA